MSRSELDALRQQERDALAAHKLAAETRQQMEIECACEALPEVEAKAREMFTSFLRTRIYTKGWSHDGAPPETTILVVCTETPWDEAAERFYDWASATIPVNTALCDEWWEKFAIKNAPDPESLGADALEHYLKARVRVERAMFAAKGLKLQASVIHSTKHPQAIVVDLWVRGCPRTKIDERLIPLNTPIHTAKEIMDRRIAKVLSRAHSGLSY